MKNNILDFLIKKMSWFYMVIIYIYLFFMFLIVSEFGKTAIDGFIVTTLAFLIIILQLSRWSYWFKKRRNDN